MNHKNISPIPKSRGDLFIRVHNMIKCEKLDIWLNRRSPALIKVVQKCLGHILEHEELNGAALKYVDNFCKQAPYFYEKSKSRMLGMFSVRKTYFDAMIPIETMNVTEQYQCNICKKRFAQKAVMVKHIQIEHPPTNKCQICMIAYFTKEDLNNHDRLVHQQQKNINPLPQKILKVHEEKKPEKTPNKPSEESNGSNPFVIENDIYSTTGDVTVENESKPGTVEFKISSDQEFVNHHTREIIQPYQDDYEYINFDPKEVLEDNQTTNGLENISQTDDTEMIDATLIDPDIDLSEEFLETILKHVDELCDNIKKSDYDIERTLRVNQKLSSAVNCYRNILDLRKEIIDEPEVQELVDQNSEEILQPYHFDNQTENFNPPIHEIVDDAGVQQLVNQDSEEILQPYYDNQNVNINQTTQISSEITDEMMKFVKNQCGNHTVVSMAKTLKVPNSLLAQWVIGNKISILESADKKIITKNQDDCHFCEVDIIDSQIVSYLKFDNELDMFQCSICNERKIKRCNMIRHIKENHISEMMTSNSNSNTNFSKIIDCGNLSCKKVYGSIKQRKKFWCEQCTAIFKVSSASKKRMSNKSQKKRIKIKELCPECGKSVSDLKNHLNVVHYVEKQTCSQCGKVLQSLIALKAHIKEIHEKVPCAECGKLYGSSTMTRHIHSAHTPNDQKKFKCEVCDKGFSESHRLKDHMNIHTGEKPYKCKYCANCFANRGNQRMHERGHEGYRRNYSKKTQTFQN